CFLIKLNSPTHAEIRSVLDHVVQSEKITISNDSLNYLINYAGNLKEALHLLQLLSTQQINLKDVKVLTKYLLQDDNCYVISRMLLENAGREICVSDLILDLRKLAQELLIECIAPIQIIKRIFGHLFDYTSDLNNDELAIKLVKSANYFINGLKICNKPIYYIEGFCLQVYQYLDQKVIATQISDQTNLLTKQSVESKANSSK
ncbi:MAG TPA: hypothetical protein PLS49_09685, partial [Candidatus Woesebacteria bacterium]|nr:hypothetical protein [Candidatus Woesebacteria bacterium]